MNSSFTLTTTPSEEQLSRIYHWLKSTREKTGESFLSSWPGIEQAKKKGQMAVFLSKEQSVGFAKWTEMDDTIQLGLFYIEKTQRGAGLGAIFFEKLFLLFQTKEKFAIQLECSPAESERFWRRHGFLSLSFQKEHCIDNHTRLYRSLVGNAMTTELDKERDFVVLWDKEPAEIGSNDIPRWTWEVQFKAGTNELITPIVFSCQQDWLVQYISKGIVKISLKAKMLNDMQSYANDILAIQFINGR